MLGSMVMHEHSRDGTNFFVPVFVCVAKFDEDKFLVLETYNSVLSNKLINCTLLRNILLCNIFQGLVTLPFCSLSSTLSVSPDVDRAVNKLILIICQSTKQKIHLSLSCVSNLQPTKLKLFASF